MRPTKMPSGTLLGERHASQIYIQYASRSISSPRPNSSILNSDALGFARGFHHKGRERPVESIAPHLLHAGSGGGSCSIIMSVDDIIARDAAGSSGSSLAIGAAGLSSLASGGAGSIIGGAVSTASAPSASAAAADASRAVGSGCVLGYDEAVSRLVAARLAIWDVIGASERAGASNPKSPNS